MDGKKKEMLKIFITFCATANAKLWTSGSDDGLDLKYLPFFGSTGWANIIFFLFFLSNHNVSKGDTVKTKHIQEQFFIGTYS